VTQRATQAPVPDARAAELRTRLLTILSNLATAPKDQKLVDEYGKWLKEYNEWLKGAAKTYAN